MLRDAVEAKHERISKFFHSGIGIKLQRIDADIAEEIMLTMMKRDVLVLPVHDSFIVQTSYWRALRNVMRAAYEQRMKRDIGVKIDLSFFDRRLVRIGPDATMWIPQVFDTELKEQYNNPNGEYAGYFARKQEFLSLQDEHYHYSRKNRPIIQSRFE